MILSFLDSLLPTIERNPVEGGLQCDIVPPQPQLGYKACETPQAHGESLRGVMYPPLDSNSDVLASQAVYKNNRHSQRLVT